MSGGTGLTGLVQLAASGPSPLWYATRAGGTVALVLLTATVALGIATGGQYVPRRMARFELGTLHRNLSLLTLAFLALHIVTAIADTYVTLSWYDAVLPFGASYRPLWLGLGTVAFDLMLAILATSAIRLRLGRRRWKAVHWLAYASWPLALFHGAGTGSDTRLTLQLVIYVGCLALVIAAIWWRLYRAGPGRVAARLWAAVAAGAVPAVLAGFLTAGPLQPGWANRAAPAGTARNTASAPAHHEEGIE
ncbi:ferric reductase-like transmembrane domain-containing protein [Actinacidiphila oryziradicis]|uniref:ferric reductase-like transmembrane domain-containing protein n=1 Tax=Actinacidiphila oryziradicis TaxID=2571141 RepID=UPI0023EF5838|nr:ferric reductase-like transmembrane domain-containing protein [Actinacidiphila oryziradicis]MCW2875072.1 Ferric reductase like transrane component [Actinacidiphila oryziradicis]